MLAAPEQHGIRLGPVPNPLDEPLPGLEQVLLRWDYIEPQDIEFHFYLASKFGNLPDRWTVPPHLATRMASGLAGFLNDDDRLSFAPWTLVSRPEVKERSLRLFDRALPLSEKIYQLLVEVTSGCTLGEAFDSLQSRFRLTRATFNKTVALFYLERALLFEKVAPLAHEPAPRLPEHEDATARPAGSGVRFVSPVAAEASGDQEPVPAQWHSRKRTGAAPAALIATSGGK